jgi:hypothetical protein
MYAIDRSVNIYFWDEDWVEIKDLRSLGTNLDAAGRMIEATDKALLYGLPNAAEDGLLIAAVSHITVEVSYGE